MMNITTKPAMPRAAIDIDRLTHIVDVLDCVSIQKHAGESMIVLGTVHRPGGDPVKILFEQRVDGENYIAHDFDDPGADKVPEDWFLYTYVRSSDEFTLCDKAGA